MAMIGVSCTYSCSRHGVWGADSWNLPGFFFLPSDFVLLQVPAHRVLTTVMFVSPQEAHGDTRGSRSEGLSIGEHQ